MKTARDDSKWEKSFRKVEKVMREEGISIIDGQITFPDGKIFVAADIELRSGFSPDECSIPREDESCVLLLQQYME